MPQPRQPREKSYLLIALHQAIKTGEAERNPLLHAQRLQRLAELDAEDWVRTITNLPELAPYQTVTEGIVRTAHALDLPLPPIEDQSLDLLGGPRSGFSAVVPERSLRVFVFDTAQPAPYYATDLFDATASYQGDAPTLMEVTRLISDWLAQGVTFATLVQRYAWMRPDPVRPSWRVRLDNG